MEERKYRAGQADLIAFSLLQTRCKELFFEYLEKDALGLSKQRATAFVICRCGLLKSGLCQSPIEEILEFALKITCFENEEKKTPRFKFENQKKIQLADSHYIADFYFDSAMVEGIVFTAKKPLKLIIECDGHDFHEKTQQQVEHDNKRDYELRMAGYDILHFSGSQIYKEPLKCAQDVYDYIQMKVEGWDYG